MSQSAGAYRDIRDLAQSAYSNSVCAIKAFFADGMSSEGAALAFYSAFSLAPLLLILVAVLGWLLGTERADAYVHDQLRQLVGVNSADNIYAAALKSRASQADQQIAASVASIGAVLLGATSVFAEIQTALNRMWGTASRRRAGVLGWVMTRVLSVGLVLAIGFLLLVSLAVSTWLAALKNLWSPLLGDFKLLTLGVDFVLAIALNTLLFAIVYRYLPAIRLRWRVVLAGGLFTALLFYLGRIGISFYLARAAAASLYGAAASFAVLLIWLYYTAQIFLLGAQFTACSGGRREANTDANSHKSPAR